MMTIRNSGDHHEHNWQIGDLVNVRSRSGFAEGIFVVVKGVVIRASWLVAVDERHPSLLEIMLSTGEQVCWVQGQHGTSVELVCSA